MKLCSLAGASPRQMIINCTASRITIDSSSADLAYSDDAASALEAYGWQVLDADGQDNTIVFRSTAGSPRRSHARHDRDHRIPTIRCSMPNRQKAASPCSDAPEATKCGWQDAQAARRSTACAGRYRPA